MLDPVYWAVGIVELHSFVAEGEEVLKAAVPLAQVAALVVVQLAEVVKHCFPTSEILTVLSSRWHCPSADPPNLSTAASAAHVQDQQASHFYRRLASDAVTLAVVLLYQEDIVSYPYPESTHVTALPDL